MVAKTAAEVARSMKSPEMRDKFIQQGADPVGSTPEEFGDYMRAETAKWAKLVKAVGAKVD
jgi:tripartite-type tricarboxylate transporter receptor subunit TctC